MGLRPAVTSVFFIPSSYSYRKKKNPNPCSIIIQCHLSPGWRGGGALGSGRKSLHLCSPLSWGNRASLGKRKSNRAMVRRIQVGRFCLWCLRTCRKTTARERWAWGGACSITAHCQWSPLWAEAITRETYCFHNSAVCLEHTCVVTQIYPPNVNTQCWVPLYMDVIYSNRLIEEGIVAMENLSYNRERLIKNWKRVGKQQWRRRFYPVSLLICDCLAPPSGHRHTRLLNAVLVNLKEERFQLSFITAFEITADNTGGGPEAAPPVELPLLVSVPLSSRGPRTPPSPPILLHSFSPRLRCCRLLRKQSSYPRSLPLSPSCYQPGNQSATGYLKPNVRPYWT